MPSCSGSMESSLLDSQGNLSLIFLSLFSFPLSYTHLIFNCWNCRHSLYERVRLKQNHSGVTAGLVVKAFCWFSQAHPVCRMLLWETDYSSLFYDVSQSLAPCLRAPLPMMNSATNMGWWERRGSHPRTCSWECLWTVWVEDTHHHPGGWGRDGSHNPGWFLVMTGPTRFLEPLKFRCTLLPAQQLPLICRSLRAKRWFLRPEKVEVRGGIQRAWHLTVGTCALQSEGPGMPTASCLNTGLWAHSFMHLNRNLLNYKLGSINTD